MKQKKFDACDIKAFVVTEHIESEGQRHAWAVVNQTVEYRNTADRRKMRACKDRRKAVLDVPDKFAQEENALRSSCKSKVFVENSNVPTARLA